MQRLDGAGPQAGEVLEERLLVTRIVVALAFGETQLHPGRLLLTTTAQRLTQPVSRCAVLGRVPDRLGEPFHGAVHVVVLQGDLAGAAMGRGVGRVQLDDLHEGFEGFAASAEPA